MSIIFRGHTVRAVSESFQQAKDAGFKVVSHMMPDLPNVDFERDVEQFIVSERSKAILFSIFRICEKRISRFARSNLWGSGTSFGFLACASGSSLARSGFLPAVIWPLLLLVVPIVSLLFGDYFSSGGNNVQHLHHHQLYPLFFGS